MMPIFATNAVNVVAQRVGASWPWYVIRGAGFVAAGLLILLMISGIGQVTGITYRYVEPIKAWMIHRALAYALCASIAIHAGFLLIDKFVPFSLSKILVPFASNYNNGTTLGGLALGAAAVTFGILASYGIVIIVASSLGWIDTKKRAWRKLHYLSYLVAVLVFLHALYVGSDLKYGIFRLAWIMAGLLMILAIVIRLWRAGIIKSKPTE